MHKHKYINLVILQKYTFQNINYLLYRKNVFYLIYFLAYLNIKAISLVSIIRNNKKSMLRTGTFRDQRALKTEYL